MVGEFVGFGLIGCLVFTGIAYLYIAYLAPPPYAGIMLQKDIVYVSARRFEANGLEILAQQGDTVTLKPLTEAWRTFRPATVTIFVHGYNAQEHKVATYFAKLAADLRETEQYKGSIIVFDWPAMSVPFDELPATQRIQLELMAKDRPYQVGYELSMYFADKATAENTGALSFLALIDALSEAGVKSVDVVAHSMGCQLILHAMQRRAEAFSRIGYMAWLAPDVDQGVISDARFRKAVENLGNGLSVHYSANDSVLTRISRLANLSSRLGATGPGQGQVPQKMQFVDMTATLGTENVHAGYLLHNSASSRLIGFRLKEAHGAM